MGRSSHSKYKHIYIWLAWINPQDWCWRDLFHISLPPGSQSSQTIISSIESDFSARCETSVEFHQAGLALLHLPTWWWILFNVRQGVSGLSWYHMLWWNQFSISFYDLQTSPHHISRLSLSQTPLWQELFRQVYSEGETGRAVRINNTSYLILFLLFYESVLWLDLASN